MRRFSKTFEYLRRSEAQESSGNVFADIGLPNADRLKALADKIINREMRERT